MKITPSLPSTRFTARAAGRAYAPVPQSAPPAQVGAASSAGLPSNPAPRPSAGFAEAAMAYAAARGAVRARR